jgi:peptidoglycan/xylan/chitin deacetylase (PgdA/CDA1 family)
LANITALALNQVWLVVQIERLGAQLRRNRRAINRARTRRTAGALVMRTRNSRAAGLIAAALISGTFGARSAECPGHPDAIGTSRVLAVDPAEHPRVGSAQYRETLPLGDHEVVLTFDDGPLPPYSTRILDTLATNCVKATFFIIGRMAQANPDVLRRAYADGHSIGTHTQNHPIRIGSWSGERAAKEIDTGIAAVTKVLGLSPAPFFRFPGLGRSTAAEKYLALHGIMVWSADVIPDDWKRISAEQVVVRSMDQLKRKGKGIILLHDIHERTAQALPLLLSRLQGAGFHVVHVVPAGPDRPKTVAAEAEWSAPDDADKADPAPPTE